MSRMISVVGVFRSLQHLVGNITLIQLSPVKRVPGLTKAATLRDMHEHRVRTAYSIEITYYSLSEMPEVHNAHLTV